MIWPRGGCERCEVRAVGFRPGDSAALWARCRQPGGSANCITFSFRPRRQIRSQTRPFPRAPHHPYITPPPNTFLSLSSPTSLSSTRPLCLFNNVPPSHVCCRFTLLEVKTPRLTFVLDSSEGAVHNVCGHYIQTRVVGVEDCNSNQCRHSAQHRCRPGRRCECLQVSWWPFHAGD